MRDFIGGSVFAWGFRMFANSCAKIMYQLMVARKKLAELLEAGFFSYKLSIQHQQKITQNRF
jgi:hypothetical protein